MERLHTGEIREGFFSLSEKSIDEIWKELDRTDGKIASGTWKDHYQDIVSKYTLSSRFALMRILFEKATRLTPATTDKDALCRGFSVAGIGKFPNITIEHAREMTEKELGLYRQLLMHRVEENNPECCLEAENLIRRAFALPEAGSKSLLSRDELIRLGHMVDFSLSDMQFLLLRVLGDNEADFKYSASRDLIDVFGFITHSRLSEVDELKRWYTENTKKIKKTSYAEKSIHATQDIANSAEYIFANWSPESRIENFRTWLLDKAPILDIQSKTARRIYTNLAAYAYLRTCGRHTDMTGDNGDNLYNDAEYLADLLDYHQEAVKLFFKDNKPNANKCKDFAGKLLYENAEFATGFGTHTAGSNLFYHVPYLENREVTARGALNDNIKNRIIDILMGKAEPSKSDLLMLLWFAANCQWLGITLPASKRVAFMDDFIAAATCLLDAALLPGFYPPNILEQTMLLSIALGDEDHTPSMVYESICAAFTRESNGGRTAGSTNKSATEKSAIVEYYFAQLKNYPTKTACKKACAAHFGISKSSLELYCKQYQEGNL